MIATLEGVVEDAFKVNSKLILLLGLPKAGKSKLLRLLSERRNAPIINVGAMLGELLLPIPQAQRHLHAANLMRGLTAHGANRDIVLFDNIELLFDHTLQLNPLDLLKNHAQADRVVAVWPGEMRGRRLTYAAIGHPEYRDYGIDGTIPFAVQ